LAAVWPAVFPMLPTGYDVSFTNVMLKVKVS
jgi:hypothetical protein